MSKDEDIERIVATEFTALYDFTSIRGDTEYATVKDALRRAVQAGRALGKPKLAEARTEGARQMQEKCAEIADAEEVAWQDGESNATTCRIIAASIRSLKPEDV